jgi:hypothetical protein
MSDNSQEKKDDPLAGRSIFAGVLVTVLGGLALNLLWEAVKPREETRPREIIREVIREIVPPTHHIQTTVSPPSQKVDLPQKAPVSPLNEGNPDTNEARKIVTNPGPIPSLPRPIYPGTVGPPPHPPSVNARPADGKQQKPAPAGVMRPPAWGESFATGIEEMKRTRKKLLLFCTADWEDDSQRIEEAFQQHPELNSTAENFVLVKIINRLGQAKPELLRRFTVTALPEILVLDDREKVISRIRGEAKTEAIVEKLKSLKQ